MTEVVADNEIIEQVQKEAIDEKVIYKETKDPYGFIYITTNLINGKRYLGQRKFSKGWKAYLGSGRLIKKAIKKYGKKNFHKNIICICNSQKELNEVERELTIFFDVVESDDWYNLALGGGGTSGYHISEETRQKMRNSRPDVRGEKNPNYGNHKLAGKNNPNYGKPMSEEQRKKISEKQRGEKHHMYGKHHSEETKRKIGEKNKGRTHSEEVKKKISIMAKERLSNPENHPMYGKSPSDETKKKISAARIGVMSGEKHPLYGKSRTDEEKEKISKSRIGKYSGVNSGNYSSVYCIELDEIFWGLKEVQEKYGFSRQNITGCCMGRQKFAGKHPITGEPLCWKYVYDKIKKDGTVVQGAITLGYITEKQAEQYLEQFKIERK